MIWYISRYISVNFRTLEPTYIYEIRRSKYSNINLCQAGYFYVLHSSQVFIKFFKNISVISMYLQAEPKTV